MSVPKNGLGFGTPVEKTITSYTTEQPSQPYLVKISGERFMLLWQCSGNVYYTLLDANGNPGQIYEHVGKLSDCQPVVSGNKVVWYRAEVYFSDTPEKSST